MNALRHQDLDTIERRARDLLAARFDQLAGRTRFDVMAEVAAPLSAGLDPATAEPGRIARHELSALVQSWFRTSGRPGLLSHVREHTRPETEDDLDLCVRNTARVMFQGGYSTMVAAVGNAVNTLLRHPAALERMRDAAVLRTGVDELVRFDGPVQGTSRIAIASAEIGGVTVNSGETVLILFAAADHDPAQFLEPERVLLDRSPNRHLGYGWGTHSCIGTAAARTALCALVSSLLEHRAPLRAVGLPCRRRTATMRAFDVLPATFRLCPPGSTP